MELKQVGEKTYYIENDTNIGIYMTGENRVCLIDTGSAGFGEKIDEIISEQGWSIDYIINTHTHIDHIGGNKYLMEKYDVKAYCTDIDMAFAHYEDLEAAYMNGGKPAGKLRHIFKHPGKIGFKDIEELDDAEELRMAEINGVESAKKIRWTVLPGHTFGMIGVKTPDDVWFLGDAYLAKGYMDKRRFGYLCDAGAYMETLEKLKALEGSLFVPAHGVVEENIEEILNLNIANVDSIMADIKTACTDYASLDEILQKMYRVFGMKNNVANHALLSSTVKSYITHLEDKAELEYKFIDDIMVWKVMNK